jgi:hypothetical protein
MMIPDSRLRVEDIPPRGAPLPQILAFADTTPYDPYPPSYGQEVQATLNDKGEWEGTLSQLRSRLYVQLRLIHHVSSNDPHPDDLEVVYALLDAIRARVSAR